MKEAFGGSFLFMLVIFFVVLFTGYICLSINHSRAFNVKNSIIRIIERNGTGKNNADDFASDSNFKEEITDELAEIGYRINGDCGDEDGWVGYDEQGNEVSTSNASFCIRKVNNDNKALKKTMYYFQIKTFYHLEIPIISILFDLSIKGDTKPMV